LFRALLDKCLEKERFILCEMIARINTPPRLVALVPQVNSNVSFNFKMLIAFRCNLFIENKSEKNRMSIEFKQVRLVFMLFIYRLPTIFAKLIENCMPKRRPTT